MNHPRNAAQHLPCSLPKGFPSRGRKKSFNILSSGAILLEDGSSSPMWNALPEGRGAGSVSSAGLGMTTCGPGGSGAEAPVNLPHNL